MTITTKKKPVAYCMTVTPFKPDGSFAEDEFRQHLRRMVAAGCGVYLGSGGSGEGHTLTLDELSRVYEIGVEECKGRVPVCANPPEQRTAKHMIAIARAAAKAGVDLVQVYQVDAGHGMRPTARELDHYIRSVLAEVDHPTALSCHFYSGYTPPASMYAAIARDFPQVRAINAIGSSLGYHVELLDAMPSNVEIVVGIKQILEGLPLGAGGYMAAEPNIAPYLCQSIVEHYVRDDIHACAKAVADLWRIVNIVTRWAPANARWLKMAMKVLEQPAGTGVLRPPYLLPDEKELQEMKRQLDQFGFARVENEAREFCERLKKQESSKETS